MIDSAATARLLDRTQRAPAPEGLKPSAALDADAAWAALGAARRELRAAELAADGLALGEVVRTHPVFGPLNLHRWIAGGGGHEARHTVQIHAIGRKIALHLS